jgi:hypothetical protein
MRTGKPWTSCFSAASHHPELNPIEKIWALVKNWVAARNVSFKAKEVEKLTKERFEAEVPTAEDWSKICEHVDKIVAEYLQKAHTVVSIWL